MKRARARSLSTSPVIAVPLGIDTAFVTFEDVFLGGIRVKIIHLFDAFIQSDLVLQGSLLVCAFFWKLNYRDRFFQRHVSSCILVSSPLRKHVNVAHRVGGQKALNNCQL